MGEYQELHSYNRANSPGYYEKGYTFARWSEDEHLLILVNFKDWVADEYELKIPSDLITEWQLADGKYQLTDQLYQEKKYELIVTGGLGKVKVAVEPLESLILKLEK
jgi:hypothetical protein